MQRSIFVLTSLCLAAGLLAQPSYNIVPRGVDLIELNSGTSIALNWGTTTTRIQQADTAHLGRSRVIRSIAWRRNGTAAKAATLTPKLDIFLAHADINKFTNTFGNNYKTKPVKLFSGSQKLDWTKPSTLPVGLWSDATFVFSAPFVYNGKDALLWETQTFSTHASIGYTLDWSSSAPATRSWLIPQVTGTGCTTKNGKMNLAGSFIVNSAPTYTLTFNVTNASSTVPVRVYIGLKNPNIPFLCGRLQTDALLFVGIGNTNAAGSVSQNIGGTWTNAMTGFPFSAQAIAIDRSAPGGGYLSNGLFCRLPKAVGGTPFAVKRIFNTSSATATTSSGAVTSSCQPTQFK